MESTTWASPAPTEDLLKQFRTYAEETFIPGLDGFYGKGTAHVGTVSMDGDEMMPAHVGAYYGVAKPSGPIVDALVGGELAPITSLNVRMSTAIALGLYIHGRSQTLREPYRTEVLSQFKTELMFLFHEATHSVGPADLGEFQREFMRTEQAGLGMWKEAVTQLSTETNLNDIIRAVKLDQYDPDLLKVAPRDTGSYVGMVEAAQELIKGMASSLGTDAGAELKGQVEKGAGLAGVQDLLGRFLAAHGNHDPGVARAATRQIAMTFTRLASTYKKTLSTLDRSSQSEADYAMEQLRDYGTQVGRELFQDIEGAAMGRLTRSRTSVPARGAVASPRSMDDLEELIRRAFGGREVRPVSSGDELRGFIVLGD
jgi:hypothetical protein